MAAHVGLTAFESWPEFGELLGARFDGHPINGPGVVINEDPAFPITRHFPATFNFTDEFYQAKEYSRDKIHVLLRLDLSNVPPNPNLHRPDGDHPLAWAKMYGKGRVFYGSFAHTSATWDIRDIQQMSLRGHQVVARTHRRRAQTPPHDAVIIKRAGSINPAGIPCPTALPDCNGSDTVTT